MIRAASFSGKTVAVFGLGASGRMAARALAESGARVLCWDDSEVGRKAARDVGLSVDDLSDANWSSIDSLVLSPGVPLTHPEPHWTAVAAKNAGVEIIGDMEIFFRALADASAATNTPPAATIAITGTNGKSTTTALIAHLLRCLGVDVAMGGNIGIPVLELPAPRPGSVYVLEVSSYQIDLAPSLAPTVGILLNVTPDHLDRHGTLAHYAAIKARLASAAHRTVYGVDNVIARTIAAADAEIAERRDRVYPVTVGKGSGVVPRFYAIGSSLFFHDQSGAHAASSEIASLENLSALRGDHNAQNALAALAAIRALHDEVTATGQADKLPNLWDPAKLADGLASFGGLAHRMEQVGCAGKIIFINDSKATNAEAAEKALSAFDDGIFWIVGGLPKAGGIESLTPLFPRIAKAFLIGDAAIAFEKTLKGKVATQRCGQLEIAVAAAFGQAELSDAAMPVVLLSPACASFDQFANFEQRGDAFRECVAAVIADTEQDGGRVDEPRVDEPRVDEPRVDEPRVDEPRVDEDGSAGLAAQDASE